MTKARICIDNEVLIFFFYFDGAKHLDENMVAMKNVKCDVTQNCQQIALLHILTTMLSCSVHLNTSIIPITLCYKQRS